MRKWSLAFLALLSSLGWEGCYEDYSPVVYGPRRYVQACPYGTIYDPRYGCIRPRIFYRPQQRAQQQWAQQQAQQQWAQQQAQQQWAQQQTEPVPDPSFERQQRVTAALLKIGGATAAHFFAQHQLHKPGAGGTEVLLALGATAARNAAIDSALEDLFSLTSSQASATRSILLSAIEGGLKGVSKEVGKQILMDRLRAANSDLATAARLAEFGYGIWDMYQKRGPQPD